MVEEVPGTEKMSDPGPETPGMRGAAAQWSRGGHLELVGLKDRLLHALSLFRPTPGSQDNKQPNHPGQADFQWGALSGEFVT